MWLKILGFSLFIKKNIYPKCKIVSVYARHSINNYLEYHALSFYLSFKYKRAEPLLYYRAMNLINTVQCSTVQARSTAN